MAKTPCTPVGRAADAPAPFLRPSSTTGHDAEKLEVYDPDLGYDAKILHIRSLNGGLDPHVAQGY
jgi:hypothetical protein